MLFLIVANLGGIYIVIGAVMNCFCYHLYRCVCAAFCVVVGRIFCLVKNIVICSLSLFN